MFGMLKQIKPFEQYITTYKGCNFHCGNGIAPRCFFDIPREDLVDLVALWDIVKEKNDSINFLNEVLRKEAVEELKEFCTIIGLKMYKPSRGASPSTSKYAEFKHLIELLMMRFPKKPQFPMTPFRGMLNDKEPEMFNGVRTFIELYDRGNQAIKRWKKIDDKNNQELILAASLAAKYNVPLDAPNLIEWVREANKEEWLMENYPEGTQVYIKFCDTCNYWTVGERRCECGNRRVDLCVEGDTNNWSAYPEPY